jgi:hypothetical protein
MHEKMNRGQKRSERELQAVARGKAARTPFVLMGGMALLVWGVAALIALPALLIWLLA